MTARRRTDALTAQPRIDLTTLCPHGEVFGRRCVECDYEDWSARKVPPGTPRTGPRDWVLQGLEFVAYLLSWAVIAGLLTLTIHLFHHHGGAR